MLSMAFHQEDVRFAKFLRQLLVDSRQLGLSWRGYVFVKTCKPTSLAPTSRSARITTSATRILLTTFHAFLIDRFMLCACSLSF